MAHEGKRRENVATRADERPKPAPSTPDFARRASIAARLCKSAPFRDWMFATLDDLMGFARDEGLLTDFGQGIRAAAARIQDQLLCAEEAVGFLTELYRLNLTKDHERLVAANKEK